MPHLASSDPHRFGRVDPDGTVWLITGSGERVIGSWQAGDTEAAFAHFGLRFDDLQTEVALMESRLKSGTGDARKIKAAAAALAESLPEAHVLGDVDALAARLTAIVEHADSAAAADKAKREEFRAAQTARKEALAGRGGGAGRQPRPNGRPPVTGSAKSSRSGGRSAGLTERSMMRCGSAIRRPARPSTAGADRISPSSTATGQGRVRPRRRCANAPRNWPTPRTGVATGAAFRDLLTEWKAAGRAAKDVDDTLWQRFKAAQDTFFSARNAASAERDSEFRANAQAKEALLVEAEKLDTSDLEAARAALRAIGDKWDAIGKVPRERSADLERRLRAVEKKVRDAPTHGVDPEAQARADQFRTRAEQFERQAEKAAPRGVQRTPRRPGPAPNSGGSGPKPLPTHSASLASRAPKLNFCRHLLDFSCTTSVSTNCARKPR